MPARQLTRKQIAEIVMLARTNGLWLHRFTEEFRPHLTVSWSNALGIARLTLVFADRRFENIITATERAELAIAELVNRNADRLFSQSLAEREAAA